MPRQDVPYGGAICRLKERIAEIWDKLDQKLHSINGVEGDGAGNVDIVSGNAAVVINNDQIGHRIEVALDSSKLPAAAVSSVNGQTGAVRLNATDIPSNGSLTVQTDIDWCRQRINECFDSIATEEDDRLNADATLQTNINAVSANIPEMSATPDPYKGIERDAQGRAFAADPAAGATDKTLVTANWLSQTGDGAPNNVTHRNGNETISGVKTYSDRINGTIQLSNVVGKYGYEGWYKALDLGAVANYIQTKITVFTATYRNPTQYAELFVNNNDVPQIVAVVSKGVDAAHADPSNYGVMAENGRVIFYAKKLNLDMALVVNVEYKTAYGEYINPDISSLGEQTADPTDLPGFVAATLMVG